MDILSSKVIGLSGCIIAIEMGWLLRIMSLLEDRFGISLCNDNVLTKFADMLQFTHLSIYNKYFQFGCFACKQYFLHFKLVECKEMEAGFENIINLCFQRYYFLT